SYLTSFVVRDADLRALRRLLKESRLVEHAEAADPNLGGAVPHPAHEARSRPGRSPRGSPRPQKRRRGPVRIPPPGRVSTEPEPSPSVLHAGRRATGTRPGWHRRR